ncbi:site-specific DNA-methyltransferase [Alienimonas californiensis]|uniref:site-specific DNA-methyltransferase (adenine-specific) n=1 Tax=Alienimonas californiensis TaxID=2527989 RepID=A0A517P8P4_9PLAN|nr:site-specific DNA-methyltransferase [Alienimonas californiensis]QDT15735.1 Modification methylase DpnIIB [Alienimonas californiensis]
MAKRKKATAAETDTYRHAADRANNPPAALASEGVTPPAPPASYAYSPRRDPVLRSDPDGEHVRLLQIARQRALTNDEADRLQALLADREPWLEWAGKREDHARGRFQTDPVALHVHERLSAEAILACAKREDVQRDLFADPELEYREAVQFYKHKIDWSNRLILGDSLTVMSSLAEREGLEGKVQMIYLDPPYGIKFGSNFQPEVGKRDVTDRPDDLTREAEQVRAYRDTWHLGVHSYLAYLRDRLIVARRLLADTGSVFVQISDENLHRVRQVMDEAFGAGNSLSIIPFKTTSNLGADVLSAGADYLLWYAKDRDQARVRLLHVPRTLADDKGGRYTRLELADGERRVMDSDERGGQGNVPDNAKVYRHDNLTSQRPRGAGDLAAYDLHGIRFSPGRGTFKTDEEGLTRLADAERLGYPTRNSLAYVRFHDDFPHTVLSGVWTDTQTGAFTDDKLYSVQTNAKVIERCLLMTTDPGDLVLDPTCGSGTTGFVAEQWGRRWITIDTSRVAVALARQRILTAKFPLYRLRPATPEEQAARPHGTWLRGPKGEKEPHTFEYATVPHVTLGSIARNTHLNPIFDRHRPILEDRLRDVNAALGEVSDALRAKLAAKLAEKMQSEGLRSTTDADRRRWLLPGTTKQQIADAFAGRSKLKAKHVKAEADAVPPDGRFEHWHVPFDADPDWPQSLTGAVDAYRAAWRAKMDQVNACIAEHAESETLVDKPEEVRTGVRVSGPFTVEAVQPAEYDLTGDDDPGSGQFAGAPEELPDGFDPADGPPPAVQVRTVTPRRAMDAANAEAYLDTMLSRLRSGGVQFLGNRSMIFSRLDRLGGETTGLHAEGRWSEADGEDADPDGPPTVGVMVGPQYGSVTAKMVEEVIRPAQRRYEDLVIAAFSFDGAAQAVIDEATNPLLNIHAAHIRPDANPAMDGLLKEGGKDTTSQQLFTVFGKPRTDVLRSDGDTFTAVMEGMDLYDPKTGEVASTGAEKVAAWFLDCDYDGRTFCVSQAFFPDRDAWGKLAKALKGAVDPDAFAALSGKVSLPFEAGQHGRCAVKVIDPRGNEVMRVHELPHELPKGA